MTSPYLRALQMLTRWLLAVGWIALTLSVTVLLFFGNFVVAWQAFKLMGFEPYPLSQIPLLGTFANAMGVGSAELASLYGAVLTAAMALTVIGACKLANDTVTLFFDVRQAKLAGVAGPAAVVKLQETAIYLTVATILAVLVARYDVSLFALRLEALVTRLQDIKGAVAWAPQPVERLGAYLADFGSRAQWGYLAVIVGVAYTTEKAFQRASERWLVFVQALDNAIDESSSSNPAASAAHAMTDTGTIPTTGNARTESTSAEEPRLADEPIAAETSAHTEPRPVEPAPAPPADDPASHGAVPPPNRGPLVRVICGPGLTREMPLRDIERNPDYVRDGSGREWFLRSYYENFSTDARRDATSANDNEEHKEREHTYV